jgi:GTP cyclohydrolase II
MQELENRVTKVEFRLDHHEKTLDALQDSTEDFRNSLHAIEATLSQIKWFAAGALALFFADSVGLGNAIKLLGL